MFERAKRSLGQNFLQDPVIIGRIVDALGDLTESPIIEIGPGRGALTQPLVDSGTELTVIELDRLLSGHLKSEYAEISTFRCFEADVLTVDLSALFEKKAKLIGNLPYYISTAIIQHLIEHRDKLSLMLLMLQREVAERITAKPGNSDRGYLTVLVEQVFDSTIVIDVPPESFSPRPKVFSNVISMTPAVDGFEIEPVHKALVSAAFQQKRKNILNNLKGRYKNAAEILDKAAIDPRRRAETITRDEWRELFKFVE